MIMEGLTVDIKVGKVLKEYILSSNGSDTLSPDKDSLLWGLAKQYLCCYEELEASNGIGYRELKDEERSEYICLSLRKSSNTRAYCREKGKTIAINIMSRCYLTANGQNVIRRFLYKGFKKTFIDYMKGALNNNCDMKIKDAIDEFCNDHNLSMDNVTYEMLKKCWYRYSLQARVVGCICTLSF